MTPTPRPQAAPATPGLGVEIPSAPRIEVGSIGWVPSAHAEPEDVLVTAAFRFLAAPAALLPEKARELGRSMGRQATQARAEEMLRAFSHLGIGAIEPRDAENGRHVFVGKDMAIDSLANPPACTLALGFVEGFVQGTTGHAALGTEITCRSRGQSECRYLVMERR